MCRTRKIWLTDRKLHEWVGVNEAPTRVEPSSYENNNNVSYNQVISELMIEKEQQNASM